MKRGIHTSKNEDQKKNREMALDYLKEEIAKIPREKMAVSEIGIGDKTFTAEQLVRAAEDGTDEGKWFLDMIYGSILKNAKKDEGESKGRS